MVSVAVSDPEAFIELLRHAPMLEELRGGPLDRRDLEERLAVSRATSHRWLRSLTDLSLVERVGGDYALTDVGRSVALDVSEFKTSVGARLRLAPLADALGGVEPPMDLAAFADATVTSAEHGDPFSPLTRFVFLLGGTTTLRALGLGPVAPPYMVEFRDRILDGMHTEIIDRPDTYENVMLEYPEKCVQVCASGYLDNWVLEDVDVNLVLFDDHVGVGVCYPGTNSLSAFVDSGDPRAIDWGEAVYERHRAAAAHLETFTMKGLRRALAGRAPAETE